MSRRSAKWQRNRGSRGSWNKLFPLTPQGHKLISSYVQVGNRFPRDIVNTLIHESIELMLGWNTPRSGVVAFATKLPEYKTFRSLLPIYLLPGGNTVYDDIKKATRAILGKTMRHFWAEDFQFGGALRIARADESKPRKMLNNLMWIWIFPAYPVETNDDMRNYKFDGEFPFEIVEDVIYNYTLRHTNTSVKEPVIFAYAKKLPEFEDLEHWLPIYLKNPLLNTEARDKSAEAADAILEKTARHFR